MKRISLCLAAVLCGLLMFSCTPAVQNEVEGDIPFQENEVERVPEEPAIDVDSKFIEYLTKITGSASAEGLTYLLETTHTVNGVTVSGACAVSEGKILKISANGESTTAEIYTPETHSLLDCNARTYTQVPMDPSVYAQALSSLEFVSKYAGIDFVPSGYTVVDKDCYAEVAVIDGVTKIFIFDDEYNLKYIVYAMEDGALVTEEIISFSSVDSARR